MNSKKNNSTKKESQEYVKLYVPELMQLVDSGDEKMCLMMAQLEYWFGHKPDGFYKFMSAAKGDNPAYREGDSWTEEMGISDTKINNALKPICTHYQSFTAYKNEEGDKFKGKFYCSYYHKPSHQTHYLRNHEVVNKALESLSLGKKSLIFREKHSSNGGNNGNGFSGNVETIVPDYIKGEVIYTETTTKNTQEREESSHFYLDKIYKEEENKNVIQEENNYVMQEEEEEVYEAFADNVDSLENGVSVVTASDGWQNPQKYPVPFPSDFELTEDMIAWAKDKKPEIDVHDSTEKFKIYNADNSSKDWLKKWQLWIRNERTTKGTNYTSGRVNSGEELRKIIEHLNS
jgi:hypothetical protein